MVTTVEKRIIQGEFDVCIGKSEPYKATFFGYLMFTGDIKTDGGTTTHEDGTIEGELVDDFGASEISGKLKGEELTFNKRYVDSQDNTVFNFTRGGYNHEQSTFLGKYSGKNRGKGNAKCLLSNEDQKNSFALDLTERSISLAKKLMGK